MGQRAAIGFRDYPYLHDEMRCSSKQATSQRQTEPEPRPSSRTRMSKDGKVVPTV